MAIIDIIKYEGDNSTLIWKHPCEDFNIGSQLIVNESQEAVFYKNGQALDSFGPGRHTLDTQNIPLIRNFIELATDGVSPFHCQVYFINKVELMGVKWGTDSKLEYVEPTYGFPIQLGASGEMNLRLFDGRKLLINVVGTEGNLNQAQLVTKLRSFLLLHLKPYIVSLIKENKLNIFEIDEQLQLISEALQKYLKPEFAEYGVLLEHFFVTAILKPEDDKNYRRFKEIHFRKYADVAEAQLRQQVGIIEQETAAKRMVIEAQGKAEKRNIEGYTYKDERGFDVAEKAASNEGVGQFTNLGIGMGMISGVGGTIGNQVGSMVQNTMASQMTAKCGQCGASVAPNSRFCPACGCCLVQPPANELVECPKCKAQVPKGNFCLKCGASLQNKTCPKCGKVLAQDAIFCMNCGTKLS